MSSYLELCQKVARESGTVSGTSPAAVTGQNGRLLNIVNWVADSWTEIQNSRNAWRFMRKEFTGKNTTSGTAKYTAAGLSISDFAEWITEAKTLTLYDSVIGVSDEGHLLFIPWADWRIKYGRGSQTNNKPSQIAVSPANELCFGSIPDGTYTFGGEYRRTPQVLAANDDTPICPVRFHDVIVWDALMKVAEFDEDPGLYARGKTRKAGLMFDMERDQLPRVTINSEPLA